jgi:benzoyl-CoA reductase subunit C
MQGLASRQPLDIIEAPPERPAALAELFDACQEVALDPDFPAVGRWLQAHPGGKVLGHFQVYFPEEIADVAGMLPLKLMGAGNQIEAKLADSRMGSFVCSICRTSLELGLSGRLPFLDGFITQPICDAARNMAGIWGRNFPAQLAQILYLPQNATSAGAVDYLAAEYRRLAGELEHRTGTSVTDDALRASIRRHNENRRLVRELYRIKRETPWRLSATEAYALVRLGGTMPKEDHTRLLRQAIARLDERASRPQDRLRVVFEGGFCEQPPIDMLRLLEESCYVVDDDLLIGLRYLLDDVPEAGDPFRALAETYLEHSTYSPVQHDDRKPKEVMLLRRIRESKAQAAILAAAKMCEPGLDEQVAYQKALEAEKIPYLLLEFEEKMTGFERMRMEFETFVESILFD